MTNEEKQILAELGERIRDTGKFYPAPGTKDLRSPRRVVAVNHNTKVTVLAYTAKIAAIIGTELSEITRFELYCVPDLADPATLGIVKQQALDALGNEAASVVTIARRSVITGNAKVESVVLSADGQRTLVEESTHLFSPTSLNVCRAIAVANVFLSAVRQKGG